MLLRREMDKVSTVEDALDNGLECLLLALQYTLAEGWKEGWPGTPGSLSRQGK